MVAQTGLSRRAVLKSSAGGSAFLAMSACGGAKSGGPNNNWIDGIETARRIKRGDVTAIDIVATAIERAKTINPAINAIAAETYDTAQVAAAEGRAGPFGGVPSFVKDLASVAGQPTQYGSRAFAKYVSDQQPPLVDAFFESGFISLGKSTTPEFGLTGTTESLLHGPTRNPWNLNHTAGGSSGGAAALVASGVVPVAHASDGAGSIRVPSSCCGLVGLKATRGRTPVARLSEAPPLELSSQGCVSRTVRDSAAFLAAITAASGEAGGNGIKMVTRPVSDRLRIGFHIRPAIGVDVAPEVEEATRKVAVLCEDLGHKVDEIDTPYDASFFSDMTLLFSAGAAQAVGEWTELSGKAPTYSHFEPLTFDLLRYYEAHKVSFESTVQRMSSFGPIYEAGFADYDIILSPTLARLPPEIGHLRTDLDWDTMYSRVTAFSPFTPAQNVAGTPAISLPLSQAPGGLPIGAQFSAKSGGDELLLALAYELEEASPWIERQPPLFAKFEG
ncbi:MAG: amidase [Pseudomonadota bacterium]